MIRRARLERDWTQEDLASRLDTSQATINRYENGKRAVTIDFLTEVSAIFGKPAAWFIEQGDGLRESERDLIRWLRDNPDDAAVVIATFRSLKGRRGDAA